MPKILEYTDHVLNWKRSIISWDIPWSIKILCNNHYPKNLRQYYADLILLAVVSVEYGVTE